MKLNATTEMVAITRPEFANLHPFAPTSQTEGIRSLIADLSAWLCEITGYDAVSLQPNAGSQGELAGLLAIHAYHQANGERRRGAPHPQRRTAPNGAGGDGHLQGRRRRHRRGQRQRRHGRPAGRVEQHRDDLAASWSRTCRRTAFEDTIVELCALVHDAGGQVYVDGANLNALMGLAQPGKFGADVSHLNLHKTFCIPHGGGGPGVGLVGVRAHLAPYLPNHPLAPEAGPATGVGPIPGAPYGSAGILPISWAYVRLMGGVG